MLRSLEWNRKVWRTMRFSSTRSYQIWSYLRFSSLRWPCTLRSGFPLMISRSTLEISTSLWEPSTRTLGIRRHRFHWLFRITLGLSWILMLKPLDTISLSSNIKENSQSIRGRAKVEMWWIKPCKVSPQLTPLWALTWQMKSKGSRWQRDSLCHLTEEIDPSRSLPSMSQSLIPRRLSRDSLLEVETLQVSVNSIIKSWLHTRRPSRESSWEPWS